MSSAPAIARTILDGFDKHYRLFREAGARARYRFVRGDWAGVVGASRARIQMYDQRVAEAVAVLRERFAEAVADESLWPEIKRAYIGLLHEHLQPEPDGQIEHHLFQLAFIHIHLGQFFREIFMKLNIFLLKTRCH